MVDLWVCSSTPNLHTQGWVTNVVNVNGRDCLWLPQVFEALYFTLNTLSKLTHPRTEHQQDASHDNWPLSRFSGHTSHSIMLIAIHRCTCPYFLTPNSIRTSQFLPSASFLAVFLLTVLMSVTVQSQPW